MQEKLGLNKLVVSQSVGFLAIIAISWIDELVGLRSLILGNHPYISDFRESTLEMLFVFAVWLIVVGTTRRLFARVRHLEKFLRVCAWCRRVGADGRWVQVEEFLSANFETHTSHGMCEDCWQKQHAALEKEDRKRGLSPRGNPIEKPNCAT
ncbi:MAG TPA: hypothetical protein VK530_10735 [Candidatus Acidoferrum sp.]|nr:hypothetical protein [Candidatus Acidoferrum sp.]